MEKEVYASEGDPKQVYPYRRSNPRITDIHNTLTWIIIALTLAFMFRAFVMEAFRIPTGSMADTLRGDHYHLRCPRCGYKYDLDVDVVNPRPTCPNCEYILPAGTPILAYHGDRIFVFKSIYQFYEPKRWDVVVFKNPINPLENYIKRLIALPGETVQIVDGDIYIDGKITRKPPKVQRELWMVIYDNNYHPAGEQSGAAFSIDEDGNSPFIQPFERQQDSRWTLRADGPTVFALDSPPDEQHGLFFNSKGGKRFRATYAYNPLTDNLNRPYCSDLKLDFDVYAGSDAWSIGAVLKKYDTYYSATVRKEADRETAWMTIEQYRDDESAVLAEREIKLLPMQFCLFSFFNADHELQFEFGDEKVVYDLGRGLQDAGKIHYNSVPEVRIFGGGELILTNLGLYRDIYYIERPQRATLESPFALGEDEFFVCGDNSPASLDSRYWVGPGKGNNGIKYREGTVPRDFLVGKAFFVYWANAYAPLPNTAPMIPNIHQFQVISGGSD